MTEFKPALPPLKYVQASLRVTTETLAGELADPKAEPPSWSPCEWQIARAAASLHGISPLLSRTLRWSGPAAWREFLDDQREQTLRRSLRTLELLQLVDDMARKQGLPFVALKGAALHAMGLYEPGLRPMADLDLLVRASDVAGMTAIIRATGLQRTGETWKHQVFESVERRAPAVLGEHADNSLKIELHDRITEMLPLRPVDIQEIILPDELRPGLNGYRSCAALMIHLLLHAAGAIMFRAVRCVQLHDIALLSSRMSEADWREMFARVHAERGPWWMLPPLALTARYYDCFPQWVLPAAEEACNRSLRSSMRRHLLSDVSFSDLRRSAFPGIHWAQSIRETFEYVLERATLSARVLVRRAALGADECAPLHSSAHGGQEVRWMGLRPVRPATVSAVRAALLQPLS